MSDTGDRRAALPLPLEITLSQLGPDYVPHIILLALPPPYIVRPSDIPALILRDFIVA